MKRFAVLALTLISITTFAQNYSFNGTISKEVLDNYLDRAITMQNPSVIDANLLSESERQRNIVMIDDLGAKFVGRIGGWWENAYGQANLELYFETVEENVSDIKANDPEVICQAAVFEYVSPTVEMFWIPDYVWDEFGITPPEDGNTLDYEAMLYPAPASDYILNGVRMTEDARKWIPDITKTATQMWMYYLATTYITAGCEAIHFGRSSITSRRDVGNKKYWELLERIRAFGQNHNRGLVLCDGEPAYHLPELQISIREWQEYEYKHAWDKELLFDIHASKLFIQEGPNCSNNLKEGILPRESIPQMNDHNNLGGLHPQGYYCTYNLSLYEVDNFGIDDHISCQNTWNYFVYGWDEISWFAEQPEFYRNNFLKYAHYKIKCMDEHGHLMMPGMRGATPDPFDPTFFYLYRANTGNYNQQTTIKNIWNDQFSSPTNWVRKDFSDLQVSNSPQPGIASSNLVFVGDNRMYYIGIDQRIHGYIKYNGTWLTVSPSYAAGNINFQQKVAGDLVANPSGTYLYYRGTDGLFYSYKINSDWSYTYSPMPTNQAMNQQGITGYGSLICPSDNRLYYIARESHNGNATRIHGFIKTGSMWQTVSPTHSATDVVTQQQAAGDLVSNPSGTYLYYRGTDGLFYRFKINNDWSYAYSEMPTNQDMIEQKIRGSGSLVCPSDDRLFYIATELSNGYPQRIHGFVKAGALWRTVSPSWSAHTNGQQNINSQVEAGKQQLTCSPNSQTIAYLGIDNELHGFTIHDYWNYSYFNFKQTPDNKKPSESITYKDENNLFYIASLLGDNKVHHFEYGEDFCSNQAVQQVEPNCCSQITNNNNHYYSAKNSSTTLVKTTDQSSTNFDIHLHPNPCNTDYVTIKLNGTSIDSDIQITVTDLHGIVFSNMSQSWKNTDIKFSVQDLPSGLYIIQAKNKNVLKKAKLVISR